MKQAQRAQLDAYLELVKRYHGSLDLMSHGALGELDLFLGDALAFAAVLEDELSPTGAVVDIGSGVGLPGVPIAIALADNTVCLTERRRRRASFLQLVVGSLGLANARVFTGDVRSLAGVTAHAVTAQAVGALADGYALTRHLHASSLLLVMRKTARWRDELGALERILGGAPFTVREEGLSRGGRLVAIRCPGGLDCPSSE